jgi:hypothetical protein
MPSIEIEGLPELKRAIRRAGADMPKTLRRVERKIGQDARNRLKKYPPRNKGPVKWRSRRQHYWYREARRRAGLPLKYTRKKDPWSQRLGESWVVDQGWRRTVVGTRVTYARHVQSEEDQEPMHKATGWVTDAQVVDEMKRTGVVKRIVQAEIASLLKKL